MGKRKLDRPKPTRVQFDFYEDTLDRLDKLVVATESSNRGEVVRKALSHFQELVKKSKAGYQIAFKKEGEEPSFMIIPI